MASPLPQRPISPEEYLTRERLADHKSEYFNSHVSAMGGASEAHNLIVGNLIHSLRSQLSDRSCRVCPSDLRIKVAATGLYTYPDVTIVCGQPEFESDVHLDTLLNPSILFQVLSPSTEAYDRGLKFWHYRKLPSLAEYVMIAQDRKLIDH